MKRYSMSVRKESILLNKYITQVQFIDSKYNQTIWATSNSEQPSEFRGEQKVGGFKSLISNYIFQRAVVINKV